MGLFSEPAPAREFQARVNQSSYGYPYPVVMGTAQVQQCILWVDGFSSKKAPAKGGKGGGKSGGYLYSADVVAALCCGPIVGIGDVWSGQSWLGSPTASEQYTIASPYTYTPTNASTLYNNLGVAAQVSVSESYNDYGAPSATSLILTDLATMTQVAYGTSLTAGLYSINPTGNIYNFSSADNGKTAQIAYSYLVRYVNQQQRVIVPGTPYTVSVGDEGGGSYVYLDEGVVYASGVNEGTALIKVSGSPSTGQYYTSGNNPMVYHFASGDAVALVTLTWQEYDPQIISPGQATSLNYTLNKGTQGQSPFSFLTASYPDAAFGYTNIATLLYQPMDLGMGSEIQQNRFEVITPDAMFGGIPDCNPVQCIGRVLADSTWGLGVGPVPFPTACIDNGSGGTWGSAPAGGARNVDSTAWSWFAAQSFFISPVLDGQDTAASVCGKWLEAGMCAAFFSEGLLKLVPYGDTSAAGNGCTWVAPGAYVVALDDTCFLDVKDKDPVKISRVSTADAWNVVQAKFDNRSNQYATEVVQESDQGLINRWGERREEPQDWSFIHTVTAATFAANMRIKHNGYVRNTYEFGLPFTYSYLETMDIVTISTSSLWAAGLNNLSLGISQLPVRIIKIVDDPEKGLQITAEDYPWGAHQPTLYNKQLNTSVPPANAYADPGNSEVVMFEATNRLTGFDGDQIWIGALGTSENWGSCNIFVSQDGTDYIQIGTIKYPAKLGELDSTFASGSDPDTTHSLVVDLATNCGTMTAGTTTNADDDVTLCFVDGELVSYSALTYTGQDQVTMGTYLRRGQMGSTISSHAAGSLFMLLDSSIYKYTYDPTWRGQTLYFKFQSVNAFGLMAQDLSTLTAVTFTLPGVNKGSIDASSGVLLSQYNTATFQGAWSSAVSYVVGNQVAFNGNIYTCILANTNNTPPNGTYWTIVGSQSLSSIPLGGGSIPPAFNSAFSYTSTSSAITWFWSGLTIYNADGTTTSVSNGSQNITGLAAATTYSFYPYFNGSSVAFITNSGISSTVQNVTGATTDGSTAWLETASSFTRPTSLSAEIWFKTTSTTSGGQGIFEFNQTQGTSPGGTLCGTLYMNAAGTLAFNITAGQDILTTTGKYNDGQWHHALLTWDGTTQTLYIDGVSVKSGAAGTLPPSFSGYWRAAFTDANGNASNKFNGSLALFAAYPGTVLTAAQALNHFLIMGNQGQATYETQVRTDGASYFWELADTSGSTAADSVGSDTGTYEGSWTLNQSSPIVGAIGSPADAWLYANNAAAAAQSNHTSLPLSSGAMTAATTSSGSGGGSGGGSGSGLCFSPETKIRVRRDGHERDISLAELQAGDEVFTARGTWRAVIRVIEHPYTGPMHLLPDGGLITPSHEILADNQWTPAKVILSKWQPYSGTVLNAEIHTDASDSGDSPDSEHSYTLACGLVAHNAVFHK